MTALCIAYLIKKTNKSANREQKKRTYLSECKRSAIFQIIPSVFLIEFSFIQKKIVSKINYEEILPYSELR